MKPHSSLQTNSSLRGWLVLTVFLVGLCVGNRAPAAQTFFVAPTRTGAGSGDSTENAAAFRDPAFWDKMNRAVQGKPVAVQFLPGSYVTSSDPAKALPPLELTGIGNQTNQLIIQGVRTGAVVFTRHANDAATGPNGMGFLSLSNCQNIVIRNLAFTAPNSPIGYATVFTDSQKLRIENCHWHDLQRVIYGATGTSGAKTRDVTYKNCRFERIGSSGSAHMSYNAYDPKHIRFVDCYFEDCSGQYIRFRDNTDYGVVTGCTFRSTGNYSNTHMPFISVPLHNDDNPASKPTFFNYEYFGTHFLIFNNTFEYANNTRPDRRTAILFYHSGFSPPGIQALLTAEDAKVLKTGTAAAKKELLKRNVGLNFDTIHVFANTHKDVANRGIFQTQAGYGAVSLGGDGGYDISDLFNVTPVVKTADEALGFFK